jgi:hypothetical protein
MQKLSLRLRISVSVILLLLAVTILLLYPIFDASRMIWPKIKDYERLFSEARILAQLNTPGLVKEEDWPQSIREISPRGVRVDSDLVEITISSGGIGSAWGFQIFTGSSLVLVDVQHLSFTPTAHPRIYRYITIE